MDPEFKIDVPVSKETTKNILEPTLVPLSQAIGGIIHWVFQKPIEYGIIKVARLQLLKQQTEKCLTKTPIENRTSERLGLTLKAFEDARYQLDSNILVDYFARLIAGTVDDRKDVRAVYSSILSEMTEEDAKLLNYFYNRKHLFKNQISHSNPSFKDERYRLFSKNNYYKITGDFEEGMHRNPEEFVNLFSENVQSVDVESSFLFLKSKGLIFLNPSQNSHVLINVVEHKSLNTDEWLQETAEKFSNFVYNRITKQNTEVYSLTSLGSALAGLVCHKD